MRRNFKFYYSLVFGLLVSVSVSNASEGGEDSDMSLKVLLNTDTFFGFNPAFYGTKKVSEKTDFTFYGIFWSAGTGGPGTQGWGNWTEFGLGAGFDLGHGLYFNPALGLLSGNLLSAGGQPKLGEGFVPNFTLTYNTKGWEGEVYAGYYRGLQRTAGLTNNYLHYWVNYGRKFSDFFSSGLHFEHLRFLGGSNRASGSAYDYYRTLGPYIQFASVKRGSFVRFMGGHDFRSDGQRVKSGYGIDSFWKMTVGFNF